MISAKFNRQNLDYIYQKCSIWEGYMKYVMVLQWKMLNVTLTLHLTKVIESADVTLYKIADHLYVRSCKSKDVTAKEVGNDGPLKELYLLT